MRRGGGLSREELLYGGLTVAADGRRPLHSPAMLDIRLIREQPDFVKSRLATRGGEDAARIDEVLRVDAERRKAETALQQLNADRKRLSKEIGGKRASRRSRRTNSRTQGPGDRRSNCAAERTNDRGRTNNRRIYCSRFRICPHANAPIGKDASAIRWCAAGVKSRRSSGSVLDHVALGDAAEAFRSGARRQTERQRVHLLYRARAQDWSAR